MKPARRTDEHEIEFPIDPADLIVGLGRGLKVIESFSDDHPRMIAAEVSKRTGIPRTAARRHLLTLCHFGYAQTDGKFFWLAPRVLRLGQSYLEAARFPRIVSPFIQRLSMTTGETANVSVLDGHEVVYVARSNSPRLVSIGFHAGARVPAHVVAPGLILLAKISDSALRHWVATHEFSSFAPSTGTSRKAFLDLIRSVRKSDSWILQSQLDPGLVGVAVPLLDRRGRCQASLGMTLQLNSWPNQAIEERLLPALRDTALALRPLI